MLNMTAKAGIQTEHIEAAAGSDALNLCWKRRTKNTRERVDTAIAQARTNICLAGVFSCADIFRRGASARVFWISKTIHSIRRFRRRTLLLPATMDPGSTPIAVALDGFREFRWVIAGITAGDRQSLFQRSTGPTHRINRSLDTPLLLHIRG